KMSVKDQMLFLSDRWNVFTICIITKKLINSRSFCMGPCQTQGLCSDTEDQAYAVAGENSSAAEFQLAPCATSLTLWPTSETPQYILSSDAGVQYKVARVENRRVTVTTWQIQFVNRDDFEYNDEYEDEDQDQDEDEDQDQYEDEDQDQDEDEDQDQYEDEDQDQYEDEDQDQDEDEDQDQYEDEDQDQYEDEDQDQYEDEDQAGRLFPHLHEVASGQDPKKSWQRREQTEGTMDRSHWRKPVRRHRPFSLVVPRSSRPGYRD
ncbi:hypothetical protein BOX15_Mlig033467g1, partial [Macrostomum lignano]